MTPIFDTHAHYDDEAFDAERDALLAQLPREGVARVVNVGSDLASCRSTLELAEQYDYVYAAVGVHPSEVAELDEERFSWLREACGHPKCVAVGEIGLDYHWPEPAAELQRAWFARQLGLARELALPVIIHSRDACRDTIDVLTAENARDIGGVIHCYSYTKESARTFLDMGFYIGIGGVLTFKNAKKLREAAQYIPMERIVLETDCPYLAPEPHRGQRNCSLYLPLVVTALAAVKGLSEEEVRAVAWENAHRLYHMEEKDHVL